MLPEVIAARCNHSGYSFIRKSYIRNIKCVDRRREIDWFLEESDWSFIHRGKKYIVHQEIVGDKRYSALCHYKVEEVAE